MFCPCLAKVKATFWTIRSSCFVHVVQPGCNETVVKSISLIIGFTFTMFDKGTNQRENSGPRKRNWNVDTCSGCKIYDSWSAACTKGHNYVDRYGRHTRQTNHLPKTVATSYYSTTLNFGVLPLVDIDHLTRWCRSSEGAYQRIVPVLAIFAQNLALYNKINRVLLSQALCVIGSLGSLMFKLHISPRTTLSS